MLETGIKMSFFFQTHNHLKMRMIDMSINPKQPLKHRLHHIQEIVRKWSTYNYKKHKWDQITNV